MDYIQSEEYIEYLKKNCGVRGFDYQEKSPNFAGAGIDIFLDYVKLMNIEKTDSVLEVGCGLGRLLKEVHDTYGCKLYGIDNNSKLIELAKIRINNICQKLKVSSAEKIDFPNEHFDKIFCWGVFELCEQEESLLEMYRCLKTGGLLLLTGKSHSYSPDDIEAYSAEIAVTEKNIKHTFTNYNEMIKFAHNIGFEPISEKFFQRRGYFMKDKYSKDKPEQFYEWLVVLKKVTNQNVTKLNPLSFSVKHSNAYDKKQNSTKNAI